MSINNQIKTMTKLPFREGLSDNYKDLVEKLLVVDPEDRLPLIRVFDHPWVLHFQEKYNIKKAEEVDSSEAEEESSSEELEDDDDLIQLEFQKSILASEESARQLKEDQEEYVRREILSGRGSLSKELQALMDKRKFIMEENEDRKSNVYVVCDDVV